MKYNLEDVGLNGKDNIKVYRIEVGWENVDWISLAEDRQWQTLVNTVMNFQVP
jgi:hypothetical protein